MVISMAVVLGFVLILLAFVPRPKAVDRPTIDVHLAGQQVVRETTWPIVEPLGLGSEWKATNVRFTRTTDGLRTWHAGYLYSGDTQYVSLEQTQGATASWITAETKSGAVNGSMMIAGQKWERRGGADQAERALLLRGGTGSDLTTVVVGTAPFDQLAEFAGHLKPVTN